MIEIDRVLNENRNLPTNYYSKKAFHLRPLTSDCVTRRYRSSFIVNPIRLKENDKGTMKVKR